LSARKANKLAHKNVEIAAIAAKLSSLPHLIEYTKKQIEQHAESLTIAPSHLFKRLGKYETDLMNLYNNLSKDAKTKPITD